MCQENQCKIFIGLLVLLLFNIEFFNHSKKSIGFSVNAAVVERQGCYHNGSLYADGSFVPTLEPCLNCKCNLKTLLCSLKICPEMPVPPPRGCVLVQKKNSCCPYLSCLRLHNYYNNAVSRRIASYLDHYERESIDRVVNDNFLQKRSDDDDFDAAGDICVKNGTVYKSGSAMSSSSLCSYCYCIGGQQRCVKPKCMLPLDGCKPIFVDSTCCPVRYDCTIKSGGGKSWQQENSKKKTSNKHYQRISQRLQRNRGCHHENNFYMEGQKMSADNDKPCDICFCIRGKRKCAPKKCSPSLRNCIPVIPNGQCCPSSYDCGPSIREWDRAFQSRQIGLFSWILGSDDEQNNSTDENSAESYDIPTKNSSKLTTEKSIFDVIKEGLEIIDSNASAFSKKEMNTTNNNLETKNTSTTVPSNQNWQIIQNSDKERNNNTIGEISNNKGSNDEDEDDINLFDLFLQTVTNATKSISNTTTTSTTTTSTTLSPPIIKDEDPEYYQDYSNVSFFDIFLGKTDDRNATTEKINNSSATEPYDFDYFGLFNDNDNETYDYLSVSDSTMENDSTEETGSTGEINITTDSIEARSEVFENNDNGEKENGTDDVSESTESTTLRPIHEVYEDSIQSNEEFDGGSEDYLDSEERNLSTTSNENYSTEDVQVGSLSTEDDSKEEFSTIKEELGQNDVANHKTTNLPILSYKSTTKEVENVSELNTNTENITTRAKFISTTPSIIFINKTKLDTKTKEVANKVNATPSIIFINKTKLDTKTKEVANKANATEDKTAKPDIKNKVSFLSTVIDELQSLIRKSSNVSSIKPTKIDNNSTNKIDKNATHILKEQNIVSTAIPPFKKIQFDQNLNKILNTTAYKPFNEKNKFQSRPTNKTITSSYNIDADSNGQGYVTLESSTAPSSLRATDKSSSSEISLEGEDYSHNTLPPSLPNLEIIPFLPIDALPIKEKLAAHPTYPTITERHGSAENVWSDLIEDVSPFEDSDALPSLTYMNTKVDRFNEASHNRFSPPKETEGGFVPKQPIVDGNLYYGTKLITELTTVTPASSVTKTLTKLSSTETPIAITSTDPFKDVIKTERPPDLVLLIEDKEKHLGNKQSSSYDDKQIIHITTDANYNFDSDYKQDNIIEFNNINFENISFTESNNALAENFPLDRNENTTFPEKNEMIEEMFNTNPNIENHFNVQPIENDVLAESFPLDRHDDYKKINNLTIDNGDMMIDDDYIDGDGVGFGSFLDYFLGGGGNSNQNITTSTIPPFRGIPSNLSILSNINSGLINDQLQADIKNPEHIFSYKNNSTDLSILGELLNGNRPNIKESELYKPKPQRPFSLPNKTHKIENNKKIHPSLPSSSSDSISMRDPFKGLPGLIPSYQVKRPSESKPLENDIDLLLTQINKEPFTVGAYKVLQNQTALSNSDPYVVNPIDIDELKKQQQQQKQQNDIHTEIFSKPENSNSINDPAGILKLAGCNIYGRMYRVGRIISELSNACLECKCTEIGVSCISLECSRTTKD